MKTHIVYLLHFDTPISDNHTAQHYIGSCNNLRERLQQHRTGQGGRLTQVAKERGIAFQLVMTWHGGRDVERSLKNRKDSKRLCPICNGRAAQDDLFLSFTLADVAEMEF